VTTRHLVHLATGVFLVGCFTLPAYLVRAADEDAASGFHGVLELADLGAETLAKFSGGPDYNKEDWQLFVQLLYRLGQYPTAQLNSWTTSWDDEERPEIGDLYEVTGKVVSVETLAFPDGLSQLQQRSKLYRCQVRWDATEAKLVVLTPRVPKRWANRDLTAGEPIRFRGVLLSALENNEKIAAVLLTDHLSWYPLQGVPSGQALLARHGMDVGLLDEVVHRKPFVEPSVSREGDAFYACLAAVEQVDREKLAEFAKENVAVVAEKWRLLHDSLAKQHQVLEEKTAVGRQLAIAEAVLERSKAGMSSVAPLFLQPEQEVGELVRLEGIARRAVRIAGTDRPELEAYYELEIFPPDSQDLPIVCCTTSLPPGFPSGDEIREPVRISGIFFKSWQYRSRKITSTDGETKRQRRLYTPIVVAGRPIWLTDARTHNSRWGLWGGVAFLAVLVILWINFAKLTRRDRMLRSQSRQLKTPETLPPIVSNDDVPEIKT